MLRTSSRVMRIFFGAILLGTGLTAAAAPPEPKGDAEQSLTPLRAYLPTIRHKARLDNERQYVADMEGYHGLCERYLEGGLVNAVTKNQIAEEVLRGQLRVLRRETDYRDSLDEFAHRYAVDAEHRRKMEDATISPLANLFRRYEDLARDNAEVQYKLLRQGRAKDAAKVRPTVVEILATSTLVKDTALPKRFRADWGEWRKIDRLAKVQDRLDKIREDRDKLRDRRRELEEGKELPQADRQREEALYFAQCLGSLELALRRYEEQPWKDEPNHPKKFSLQLVHFRRIVSCALAVADQADLERLGRLSRSWPTLAPVRLKEVDLLACEADKAEQTVAARLKTPDAQLAGKKRIRHLRTLAKSYRMQHELFELTYLRRENLRNDQTFPKSPASDNFSGSVEPVAARPSIDSSAYEAPRVIDAHRSLSRAKRQLLQSWIDFQMVRLDLYNDLGLSPP